MRGSSQNAVPVYKQAEWYLEEEFARGGLRRLFALASGGVEREGQNRRRDVQSTTVSREVPRRREESEERRAKRGDQAYAPFGAGRETGHQVPVVAAKIESDR
jgi:hypothetical protein